MVMIFTSVRVYFLSILYVAMSARCPKKIRTRILDLQRKQYHYTRFFRHSTQSQLNQPESSQMPRTIILRFCRPTVDYTISGRSVSRFPSSFIGLEKKIGME